jgi:hypothetical protein
MAARRDSQAASRIGAQPRGLAPPGPRNPRGRQGLVVRSLPEQESTLALDLTVNGKMTKGNWTEITSNGGYYQGAVYDGTIQMEINQAGDRLKGKWLGFGRDPGEINDGPWSFTKVSSDYSKESRQKWDVPPPATE